jgi:putative hemolysin
MRRRRLLVPLLIASATLSCGDDDEPGVPNPAAVFCEEQGGHVEIERDDAGNERGICVLPDGTRVDEWDYYRTHHPEPD